MLHIIEDYYGKRYELPINEIINLIKNDPNETFYKFIDGKKIKICNEIVLRTKFICHRINTIEELKKIDKQFGVEIDLRDDHKTGELILAHDPFVDGEYFKDYLKYYHHRTLILNIKSERIEIKIIDLLKKYNIDDYFFLDSSFPMIYLLNKEYNENRIACRFSEYEPIENFMNIKDKIEYVWVDCFSKFPLDKINYELIKDEDKKICIVSPELQKQREKIEEYRDYIINNNVIPDLICCKDYNIIKWI